MTLEYKENEIIRTEKMYFNNPLIGYINPYGKIIDLSLLYGLVGHDNWRNPVTPIFLKYISYIILNTNVKDLKKISNELYYNNQYPGFDEIVRRGVEIGHEINFQSYDDFKTQLNEKYLCEKEKIKKFIHIDKKENENLYNIDVYRKLTYDLIEFFYKAYSNNNFFDSTKIIPKALKKEDVLKIYKHDPFIDGFENEFYNEYLMIQLMSYLKDICVQYLGYHSIERAIPNKDLNLFNNVNYPSNGYTFTKNPKTILTSELKINETFYNWILMDWEIKRLPRYHWNSNTKKFDIENPAVAYHQTNKEEVLNQELVSIKKLVPLEERKKYFR